MATSEVAAVIEITVGALSSLAPAGAALYYGGKDSAKAVGTYLATAAVGTMAWALVAYSIIAGTPLPTWVIADSQYATIQKTAGFSATSTAQIVAELQFVLLAINIIAGAVAYRFNTKWFIPFLMAFVIVVYAPEAFWQLRGWAGQYGILDYAGGLLVHVSAGVAALVLGLLAGGKSSQGPSPADGVASLVSVAAFVVGCFFLNIGRAALNGFSPQVASLGLLNTQMALGAGVVSYGVLEIVFGAFFTGGKIFQGEATLTGAAKGAMIALAAVASGAGYILPMWVVLISFIAVVFVYAAEVASKKVTIPGWSVFLTHFLGGAVGVACTGLFAQVEAGSPYNGSFFYNAIQLGKQCAGISYIILMTGVATAVLYFVFALITRFVFQSNLVVAVEAEAAPAAAPAADALDGAKAVVVA